MENFIFCAVIEVNHLICTVNQIEVDLFLNQIKIQPQLFIRLYTVNKTLKYTKFKKNKIDK